MPVVFFEVDELQALQDIWQCREQVNWDAYDRARVRILTTRHAPILPDVKPGFVDTSWHGEGPAPFALAKT